MVWKKVVNADAGDADHFGGNDIDKISDAFSGIDVDDFDINSDFTIRDDKFKLRNPANTFNYTHSTNAILADRQVSYPLLTADANFVFDSFTNTFSAVQKFDNYLDLKAIAEPASPASGYIRVFIDTADGKIKIKRSNGDVVIIE